MLTSLSYKRNLPPWLDCTKVRCEQMKIFTICARDTIIHPSRRPPPAAIGINGDFKLRPWSGHDFSSLKVKLAPSKNNI